jgi:hypothetical protein
MTDEVPEDAIGEYTGEEVNKNDHRLLLPGVTFRPKGSPYPHMELLTNGGWVWSLCQVNMLPATVLEVTAAPCVHRVV